MEGLELICFQLITNAGTAKSKYMEALALAKNGDFSGAKALVAEGDKAAGEGHKHHAELIQQEASGKNVQTTLLLLHAEDQMFSTETIKIMVEELIEVYERMK